MNKNDLITLKIEDLGTDGEGIGKIDGYYDNEHKQELVQKIKDIMKYLQDIG